MVKGYKLKDLWNPTYINNTCITILDCNEDNCKFILEADTSHIES